MKRQELEGLGRRRYLYRHGDKGDFLTVSVRKFDEPKRSTFEAYDHKKGRFTKRELERKPACKGARMILGGAIRAYLGVDQRIRPVGAKRWSKYRERKTFYNWSERDEQFALAFKQADAAATERLEREAWRRATEGTPYERTSYWHGEPVGTDRKIEYSDQLMMLLLRARRPDLYREKVDVGVTQIVKAIAGIEPSSVL